MGIKQLGLALGIVGFLTTMAAAQPPRGAAAALAPQGDVACGPAGARSRAPPEDADGGAPLPAPPQVAASYPPQELDRIVSPIALYPDPLLAQVLTAATFSPEIPPAASWADQPHY